MRSRLVHLAATRRCAGALYGRRRWLALRVRGAAPVARCPTPTRRTSGDIAGRTSTECGSWPPGCAVIPAQCIWRCAGAKYALIQAGRPMDSENSDLMVAMRLLDQLKLDGFHFERCEPGEDGPLIGNRVSGDRGGSHPYRRIQQRLFCMASANVVTYCSRARDGGTPERRQRTGCSSRGADVAGEIVRLETRG